MKQKLFCIIATLSVVTALCAFASCGTSADESGASGNCSHVEVVDPAVAPTCEKEGLTEGKHCSSCGEVLTEQKIVAATGEHTYADGKCSVCGKLQATPDKYFIFTERSDGTYGVKAKDVNDLPENLVIPEKYNGKAVTAIDSDAFKEAKGIKRVVISDSVISVGADAFRYCEGIESLTIGKSVKTFGWHAFVKCTGLTELYYNSTECENMYNNHNLFFDSGKAEGGIKVVVGANVKYIPEYLFSTTSTPMHYYSYARIASVEFDKGSVCEKIGERAFEGCIDLKKATLPDSVKTIGVCAFINCKSLEEAVICEGVTLIESCAFENCESLKTAVIPDSVKTIEERAFLGCKSLTELTVGVGVATIENTAFSGCENLAKIYYNATDCKDLGNDNRLFYKAGTVGNGISLVIGANVKKIPAKMFYPYINDKNATPKITSISFAKGSACESIGEYAFKNCSSLTDLHFGDGEDKWSGITVGAGNDPIQNATKHYNSEG